MFEITPPPELVQEWIAKAPPLKVSRSRQKDYYCIAEQAAQWGALQYHKKAMRPTTTQEDNND